MIVRKDDKPVASWRPGKKGILHAAASVGGTTKLIINESWNDPGVGARGGPAPLPGERDERRPEPPHPDLVGERFLQSRAEHDPDVFDGVMQVDLEVGHEDDWARLVHGVKHVALDPSDDAAVALRDRLEQLAAEFARNAGVVDAASLRRRLHGHIRPDAHVPSTGWTRRRTASRCVVGWASCSPIRTRRS